MGGGPGLWLRRRFITGFFVTVPLVVSVVAIVWVFGWAYRLTGWLSERVLGQHVPGLGLVSTIGKCSARSSGCG